MQPEGSCALPTPADLSETSLGYAAKLIRSEYGKDTENNIWTLVVSVETGDLVGAIDIARKFSAPRNKLYLQLNPRYQYDEWHLERQRFFDAGNGKVGCETDTVWSAGALG